jgi:hypothetical protein
MRRLTSILIITGAALAVAQAAVAQLVPVPITVTSQTLRVYAFESTSGDVVGGSSVVAPFNLGSEAGSTVGTASSVLTDGELILTVDGALSNGAISDTAHLSVTLEVVFEITAPDLGAATTPIYFQTERVSSVITGSAEQGDFTTEGGSTFARSQLLGGLVRLGYVYHYLGPEALTCSSYIQMLPGDTVTYNAFNEPTSLSYGIRVNGQSTTGIFTEVIAFRAFTPTPVPEPTSSITIPSGAAMLLALAKLRGVSLAH